jgi:dTDP-4-dehydrorhamnose reductase
MPNKILVTGGKGQLAQALVKIDATIDAPDIDEMDFSSYDNIDRYFNGKQFDLVIHAGAITNKFNENVDEKYIQSNIIGTANIVLWTMRHGIRLVYISSDYVYPSERGDYTEESVLFPVNRYAKSKLGGEMAVQLYDNSLIIRTSFYSALNFSKACTDQYTSRLPIEIAAQAIYTLACQNNLRGIINLGSRDKRCLFEIVKNEYNSSVIPCTRSELQIPYILPFDSSMCSLKYYQTKDSLLKNAKDQTCCRICGSEKLYKYLDLGYTPLANSYLREEDLSEKEYKE